MLSVSTKSAGQTGEDIASEFLRRKGFQIEKRNFLRKWGEIDIIAIRDNIVHFVEVKALSTDSDDISREINSYKPEEQIHETKLRKIVRTAILYMEEHKDVREYQIDAVSVVFNPNTRQARCSYYAQIL